MFKNVIKRYINIITINDVIMFGKQENIDVSNEEATIVLNHLKTNWENIIYGDEMKVKDFLISNFDKEKSEKVFKLFLAYKKKYRNYL